MARLSEKPGLILVRCIRLFSLIVIVFPAARLDVMEAAEVNV
jgi:hypothetical protein